MAIYIYISNLTLGDGMQGREGKENRKEREGEESKGRRRDERRKQVRRWEGIKGRK